MSEHNSHQHPPQGYYGGTHSPPPVPPREYITPPYPPPPPHYPPNSYDLPPRNPPGAFIPMPPPPASAHRRGCLSRHQSLLWGLLFWIIFLFIDLFAHGFPWYPYSARRVHQGRNLLIVIYTFVFQAVWLIGIGGRMAWEMGKELKAWWRRGRVTVWKALGMVAGGVGMLILVFWPAFALGVNADVVARWSRMG